MVVGIRFVLLLVAYEPVLQHALFHLGLAFHNRPVGLVHLSFGKHLIQSGKGFGGTGKDNETSHRTIQTMYHPQEHSSWLLILLLDVVLHQLREGSIASFVALYDLPTPFVVSPLFTYSFHRLPGSPVH